MTGQEFSGVDLDLLADYVGGALDGTPDEAVVGALIAGDAAWRSAYDELSRAMAAVGTDLAALGAVDEPMPADLVASLDAAFAAEAVVAAGHAADTVRRLHAVPSEGVEATPERERLTARNRRRRLRWAVPIAAAAGIIAFAGIGMQYLYGPGGAENSAASSAAGGSHSDTATALSDPGNGSAPQTKLFVASGTDYQPGTLGSPQPANFAPVPMQELDRDNGPGTVTSRASAPTSVPEQLRRLIDSAALQACLDAIAAQNDAGPATWTRVDFARYQGSASLIVSFTAVNGKWVWATGPGCGTPGAGAARLAAVKVG